MRQPIFVRSLTKQELRILHRDLHLSNISVTRRCQILLASSHGEPVPRIAERLGCTGQTVRNVIHAFNKHGLEALYQKSSRPQTIHEAFSPKQRAALLTVLSHDPSSFKKATRCWTYKLLAEVCFEQGITSRMVTGETVRITLLRMNINWDTARIGPQEREAGQMAEQWAEQRLIDERVAYQLRSRWNSF